MLNEKCKTFIETHIEDIDNGNWEIFFEDMVLEDDPPITNIEAQEIIYAFLDLEIPFSQESRKIAILSLVKESCTNLYNDDIQEIDLATLYDIDNGNWGGYLIEEFRDLLINNSDELEIEVDINSSSTNVIIKEDISWIL